MDDWTGIILLLMQLISSLKSRYHWQGLPPHGWLNWNYSTTNAIDYHLWSLGITDKDYHHMDDWTGIILLLMQLIIIFEVSVSLTRMITTWMPGLELFYSIYFIIHFGYADIFMSFHLVILIIDFAQFFLTKTSASLADTVMTTVPTGTVSRIVSE